MFASRLCEFDFGEDKNFNARLNHKFVFNVPKIY